jgi:hypothetical protein
MATMELELKIACPKCGKSYRWKSSLAGRKVQCKKCAASFRMPADPPLNDDVAAATDQRKPRPTDPPKKKAAANLAGGDGNGALVSAAAEANPYDILDPEEQPRQDTQVPCRECEQMIASTDVICVHCGINQRTGLLVDGAEAKGGKGRKGKKKKKPAQSAGNMKFGTMLKLGVALAALAGAAACYFMFIV